MDETKRDLPKQKTKTKRGDKKRAIAVTVFVLGLITLVVGVAFLVVKLVSKPAVADAEYLVSAKEWTLKSDDCSETEGTSDCNGGVIWDFTEIGKGTLTTNGHMNDYGFVWAIEDGKLLIETDWLYDLENQYEYKLDQGSGTLILTDDGKTYEFVGSFEK